MRVLLLLALGGFQPSPAPQEAPPKVLALRGAKVYPGSGPALEHATILVEGGRITAVGRDLPAPSEATVVELSGKVVIPGLIDAASRLFLEPDDRGPGSAEQNVLDAVDRTSELYQEAVEEGVTAVYVGPPSTGPVNGLGAVLRPDRRRTVLVRDAALKLSVGLAPGDTSTPVARYESFVQIRQALDAARQYGEAWAK
ncbi:MAG TPA: hypothetical protein VEN81_16320, partial [Planctomycetota bacterium]|nr:hypothetical protein [Planctomycetota bacterium]